MLIPKQNRSPASRKQVSRMGSTLLMDYEASLIKLKQDFQENLNYKISRFEKVSSYKLDSLSRGEAITCLEFYESSEDSFNVLCGSTEGSIYKIDMNSKRIESLFNSLKKGERINALCANKEASLVIVAANKDLLAFNIHSKKNVFLFSNAHDNASIISLAVTRDGRYVISGGDNGSLKVFDTNSLSCVFSINPDEFGNEGQINYQPVGAIATAYRDRYVIIGLREGSLMMIDLEKRTRVFTYQDLHEGKYKRII